MHPKRLCGGNTNRAFLLGNCSQLGCRTIQGETAAGNPKTALPIPQSGSGGMSKTYKLLAPKDKTTLLYPFSPSPNWCWPAQQKSAPRPLVKAHRWVPAGNHWFQAFPFWQFHVLFNSLFKVLFIFPSRYLFAIGLSPILSFGWYLPPI